PAIWLARELLDRAFDLRSVVHRRGNDLDAEIGRRGGDGLQKAAPCGMPGERHKHDAADTWGDLRESFQPFTRQCQFEMREPGDVGAWPRNVHHHAEIDWVGHQHEDDGYGGRQLLQLQRWHGAIRQDNVGHFADELHCIGPYTVRIARPPNDADAGVAIVNPSCLLQGFTERGDTVARLGPAFDAHQYADDPHTIALLAIGSERPGRRPAEQRDEAAPPYARHLLPPA